MVEILAPAILKRVTGSFLDGVAIDVTFMFNGFNVVRIERSRKCLINYKNITSNYRYHIRDWSKSIGEGGLEQKGGGSSVFEPLARGGSFYCQRPIGGGSSYFKQE